MIKEKREIFVFFVWKLDFLLCGRVELGQRGLIGSISQSKGSHLSFVIGLLRNLWKISKNAMLTLNDHVRIGSLRITSKRHECPQTMI